MTPSVNSSDQAMEDDAVDTKSGESRDPRRVLEDAREITIASGEGFY